MKKLKTITAIILSILAPMLLLQGCTSYHNTSTNIVKLDLSRPVSGVQGYDYLYENTIVDASRDYLAHPDSILLNNDNILTLFPAGHGKGEILSKISVDGGRSWTKSLQNPPTSWKDSEETPTLYRLNFNDGREKLIMISACPKWNKKTGDGFNISLSLDDGETWSEFEKFYGKDSVFPTSPIVAMSSLTRLKENGEFADKWMGLFHDHKFVNYKTILTFNEDGNANWSVPEPYFSEYRQIEKKTAMCEVEVIRSDNGLGDELCLITRSNGKMGRKTHNSLISFSSDEGESWSEPVEVPASLSGERHKARYVEGRLFITFRSIEREKSKVKEYKESFFKNWYSEGWVAWVGTYDDLKNGNEGQYRIKLAHTYLSGQTEPAPNGNADTGYAGLVVLPDNTIVATSYGTFGDKIADNKGYRTYIISKRIKLSDIDQIIQSREFQDYNFYG